MYNKNSWDFLGFGIGAKLTIVQSWLSLVNKI
ncbi:hypothetical protein Goshw_022537 [Gossypium schwendimanii]|uniref:Uncharacterized protein n=1 Tax=Gossypium schwendimanii TaxID=34291 RepID=A0A7J9LBE2_GOSSC|nr:hypothetical protein [Gossypium schwendimanii]